MNIKIVFRYQRFNFVDYIQICGLVMILALVGSVKFNVFPSRVVFAQDFVTDSKQTFGELMSREVEESSSEDIGRRSFLGEEIGSKLIPEQTEIDEMVMTFVQEAEVERVALEEVEKQKKANINSNIYTNFDEFFSKYASQYGVDEGLLKRIAKCESHFNPEAGRGKKYGGMFQFLPSTWKSTRIAMGENPDVELMFNADEAIKTSAWKIAHGGRSAWPVCGK